jgi:DNA-binding PadR family transcriptional regulator
LDHIVKPGHAMTANPKNFIPLRPVEFLVLLALAEQEHHGYGLTQEIERRTQGSVQLEPGNLYKVLKRLVTDGLIEASDRRPAADADNERRRYYRLTSLGAQVASLEAARLESLLASDAVRSLAKRLGTA